MTLPNWLDTPFVHALGWTLVHSLWQATIIALVLRLLWAAIARRGARVRYGLALGAMLSIIVAAGLTFAYYQRAYQPVELDPALWKNWSGAFLETPSEPEALPALPLMTRILFTIEGYLPWLVLFWLLGAVSMGVRLAGGWWHLRRLSRRGIVPLPLEWAERFAELAKKMGVLRSVELRFSSWAPEPITLKHFRPLILFPVGLINQLSVEQVEAILLHELAHIRRWDYLVNWLQSIVELLFFYHPAVWWLSRQVREAREHCCDDLVLERGGARRILYAQTLTQLKTLSFNQQTKLAMSANGVSGTFTQRVKRLFGHYEARPDWRKPVLSTLICVIILISFGLAPRPAERPATEPENILPEATNEIAADEPQTNALAEMTAPGAAPAEGEPAAIAEENASGLTPPADTIPKMKRLSGDRPLMPLVVVDGVIMGRDTNIIGKPYSEHIERINVLKGIEAILKYGPAGEDGVLEIFTKLENGKPAPKPEAVYPPGMREELFMRGIRVNNPIYVVNGENWGRDPEKIKNLKVDDIQSMHVLEGEAAWLRYGEEGRYGVLIIETKPKTAEQVEPDSLPRHMKVQVFGQSDPSTRLTPPLYIVDGMKWDRRLAYQVRELDPQDIEAIEVLREEEATKVYGRDGRWGVVIITTKSKAHAPAKEQAPLYIVNDQVMDPAKPWREVDPLEVSRIQILPPAEAVPRYGEAARHGAVILGYDGAQEWSGENPYLPVYKDIIDSQLKNRLLDLPDGIHCFIDGVPVSKAELVNYNALNFFPKGNIMVKKVGKVLGYHSGRADLDKVRSQHEDKAFVYELGPGIVAVEFFRDCDNTTPVGLIYSPAGQHILEVETIYKNQIRATTPPAQWRIKCRDDEQVNIIKEAPAPPQLGPEMNASLYLARKIKSSFRAFPNPFQEEIKLVFELPQTLETRITIFNANGQLMTILVDQEVLEAGSRELVWNAAGAPNGSYIVMIEAGGSRITQTIQKQ